MHGPGRLLRGHEAASAVLALDPGAVVVVQAVMPARNTYRGPWTLLALVVAPTLTVAGMGATVTQTPAHRSVGWAAAATRTLRRKAASP